MSKLALQIPSMSETDVMVGSEGAIHIRENGGVIRILDAAQARHLANTLQLAADHAEGKLIGDGV
jgi:hypothetical protein